MQGNLYPTGEPQKAIRGGMEDLLMIFAATQTDTVMGSLYALTETGTKCG